MESKLTFLTWLHVTELVAAINHYCLSHGVAEEFNAHGIIGQSKHGCCENMVIIMQGDELAEEIFSYEGASGWVVRMSERIRTMRSRPQSEFVFGPDPEDEVVQEIHSTVGGS